MFDILSSSSSPTGNNAFSAMLKQDRLTIDKAHKGLTIFEEIPVRYTKPDFSHALALAHRTNMYSYDAYFLIVR